MANGRQIFSSADQVSFALLDGQVNSGKGPWVAIPNGLNNKVFEASDLEEGNTDAEVNIEVSNSEAKPPDNANEIALVTLNAVRRSKPNTAPYRFARAEKIQGTTPKATTVTMTCAK